ncbi:AI-2E family transporter [Actinopolymorpha alba]|uniref:AI-2E family transporter n=1 Tax=Actinopolymorpha alba TaxID=533267 RepID=UPI00036C4928|nr:AI-2E family transporter [Actinopolymorpha alba]
MSGDEAVASPTNEAGNGKAHQPTAADEPTGDQSASDGPRDSGAAEPAAAVAAERLSPEPMRFGPPGARLSRHSPFYLGFFGAMGALLAWQLANMLASARSVLVLLVISLYLAVGLNPVVEWFVRRRVRRGLAVAAVFVGLAVILSLLGLAIIPVVTDQVTTLVNLLPEWLDRLRTDRNLMQLDDQYEITKKVQEYITSGGLAERLFGGVLGAGRVVFSTLFSVFTVLVLTLYFLGSLPATKSALYKFVPRSRRVRVTRLGDEILDRVGSYVGGQIAVAAIAATAAFIFFMIAGLHEFALALAITVAVLGLIPLIGGAVSAVVGTSVGLLTDVKIGIACLIYFIIYQQIENYLIYPRVMQRSVNVPGSVIVVAALVGGSLLGILGALLAVPTAAAILLLIREVIHPRLEDA